MRIKLFKLYTVHASFCTFSIRMSLFLSAGKPTPLSWLTYEVWIWVNSPALALGLRRMVSQFSPTYLSSSTTLLLLLCMLPLWRHKIANILLLFMERSSDVDWTVYEFCGKMWYFISLKIFLELFTLYNSYYWETTKWTTLQNGLPGENSKWTTFLNFY